MITWKAAEHTALHVYVSRPVDDSFAIILRARNANGLFTSFVG
jgi:hypothetical protein